LALEDEDGIYIFREELPEEAFSFTGKPAAPTRWPIWPMRIPTTGSGCRIRLGTFRLNDDWERAAGVEELRGDLKLAGKHYMEAVN
jgi:hypothetical protein